MNHYLELVCSRCFLGWDGRRLVFGEPFNSGVLNFLIINRKHLSDQADVLWPGTAPLPQQNSVFEAGMIT